MLLFVPEEGITKGKPEGRVVWRSRVRKLSGGIYEFGYRGEKLREAEPNYGAHFLVFGEREGPWCVLDESRAGLGEVMVGNGHSEETREERRREAGFGREGGDADGGAVEGNVLRDLEVAEEVQGAEEADIVEGEVPRGFLRTDSQGVQLFRGID